MSNIPGDNGPLYAGCGCVVLGVGIVTALFAGVVYFASVIWHAGAS